MVTQADTIVVGGGAMGSATTWQLAARGRAVIMLEKFDRGHAQGASHGSTRNFNVGYTDPAYVNMLVEAQRLWRELELESETTLLEQTGIVNHGANPHYEQVLAALARVGMPAEFLPPGEAQRRWPGIRFDGRVLYTPEAGRLNAALALSVLHEAAVSRGAELRFNTPAIRLEVVDDELVRITTADEVFEAPRVVVTAGAWTRKLLGERLELPQLVVTQEQPAHFAAIDESLTWPGFNHVPTAGDPAYDYWYSPIYGMYSPGEGVKAGWHGVGPVMDPDARDFTAEPVQLRALQRYVREWLPGADPDRYEDLSCTYTTAPDSNFVLRCEGPITVGAGFAGHGFKFTPAIGRILADLSDGSRAAPELTMSPWP